ncbi:multicomponent Na+:H+ antiporter subunit G [Thermotomaculum hydrothermale]|uniref:Multicomponent Na+:H+ antiporter subunit G n=1 Tax=Thermotomaculum hydrothermale TaxID=981385 RepID=A0A7R6PVI3_9BACT|nr:monovalent cation/H(+) antiporter subunit G [Thermotomaculum hydrothermale]BBB33387.1 multicomponent Na+:H+ antiporter subunit G [Thermotomaculum hydrothermale]
MLHTAFTYIGNILLVIGCFFMFVSAIGIVRMPDLYNRLQAGTKASTLGAMCTIMGVGFLHPDWWIKCFLLTLFILMTNPLSSSVLARASLRSGVKPYKLVIDECEQYYKNEEEN